MRATFLLLLLFPSLAFADRPECEKAGGKWSSDLSGAGCTVKGKKQGIWELRSPTGQLLTKTQYVDGEPEGATASFHDTCMMAEKGTYTGGKKQDTWSMWFDNGQRQAEGTFKDDLRDGLWKFFIDDAAVIEGPMVADAATGTFTERFTTGVTWRKVEMKDGLHTSPEAVACVARGGTFDVDYKARTEGCFVEEQREGAWLGYSPEGKLEWRSDYVKGVEHGERLDFHPGGQILRKGRIEKGNPTGVHEFRGATGQVYGTNTIEGGAGVWKAFFADGVVSEEGQYKGGVRDGTWRTFHRKGALLDETTWENGVRNGPYREHYPTGEIKIVGTYLRDIRAAQWSAYYMNGKLVWSGRYDASGRQAGIWFLGNFDGSTAGFGTMKINKRDGIWTLFHETGVLAGIGTYAFGKKQGTWFEWWPSGKFWRQVEYENDVDDSEPARACLAIGGMWIADVNERAIGCQVCRSATETDQGPVNQLKDGLWTWWHANAAVEKRGAFELGARTGRWQSWFDNNQLMLENTFVDDKETGPSRGYYRDGKKRFEGSYVVGAEDGEWTTLHADGSIASIGRYAAGKKTGRWKYNYAGGTPKEEGEYTDGAPSGTWTSYHLNGARATQGAYAAGKRDGEWTYWRADGAVWRTEKFAAGKRVLEPIGATK
jgi:antitoxin component YwqK of YwqJK toxin-antitoxin module